MDTLVIGDLHGQVDIARRLLKEPAKHYKLVFVGDYLDSFHRSPLEQFMTLTLVAGAARTSDTVTALLGNHERSYLYDEPCGGWNSETQELVYYYRDEFREILKDYVWVNDVLITHAGVTLNAIPYRPDADETGYRDLVTEFINGPHRGMCGPARGGRDPYGGIYWCDFRDEFVPVPGIRQVFGHSRGSGIRDLDGNWCIDCLEDDNQEVLLIRENGDIEQIELVDII